MFDEKRLELEIGGRTLSLSTGKFARQSNGAVMVQYGDTVMLCTVNRGKEPRVGIDFFPLTVDYIEKYYAAGKFPGGFNKREARPSIDATLIARLTDRPIRPMFPDGFNYEVQIVNTIFSYDGENTPDYLGIVGASAAIMISDIPFLGPVASVTVGRIDGEFVLNPSPKQLEESDLNLKVGGTKDAVNMVEAGAQEMDEETMLQAIMFAHENIKKLCIFQEEFTKLAGKEKIEFVKEEPTPMVKDFLELAAADLRSAVLTTGKQARQDAVDGLHDELKEKFVTENYPEVPEEELPEDIMNEFDSYYDKMMKRLVREVIIYEKHRVDGRKIDEIRPLYAEVGTLPMPHGSAMFTRGETQALVTTTLGSKANEQLVDNLDEEYYKKFYLHYNFPAYSVGETGRNGAPGRRELGHGSLAERALSYVMPSQEVFPYTVRVVSDITESNGSSSQASICGGSLALMDAGVPIKEHVAGIAMGLVKEGEEFTVLTDIMGLEDHLGDMDFKVAGTKSGITALQMDIKITGITEEIMRIALNQALVARLQILEVMNEAIPEPRKELAPTAPRIVQLQIATDKIGGLIGPGGKNIKRIVEETGATVDITDDGKVSVFCSDLEALEKTIKMIEVHTKDVEVGEVYSGRVVKIAKFGAFMEILPGKEGLLHVSEISKERVANVEDVLKEGDVFDVKVISAENGKISLSKKRLLTEEN